MNRILEGLTDAQREAVAHIDGPLLVIAGPGSGKTRVISHRIANLVYCGIRPWNILAITFTNKAAGEMRSRVDSLVEDRGVWVSTFHALCARHLRTYAERIGYGRDFTILDSDDSRKAVAIVLKGLELPSDTFKPAAIRDSISSLKSQALSPDEFAATIDSNNPQQKALAAVYAGYQAALERDNCMDFDDLLMQMGRLLKTDDDALAALQKRHRFILVDEFQDTNRSQYEIARLLSGESRNLCATGDPDQSIYGWRGADITNILDFEADFPEAKVVFLDRNYRSTKTILAAADALVARNLARKPRKLFTTNDEGRRIRLSVRADGRDEARGIADELQSLVRNGAKLSEAAVLYRVNSLSRQFEEALISAGVPYQMVAGVEFYNRKEIKDVVAYLRAAVNPADTTSISRAINTPSRGVGARSIETLVEWAAAQGVALMAAIASEEGRATLRGRAREGAAAFAKVVAAVKEAGKEGALAAVTTAIEASGYADALAATGKEEDRARIENLNELVNAAAEFDEGGSEESLRDFLDQAALVSDVDGWDETEDKVTLMTMHAAKGLEFPHVFIGGIEETILPHARSVGSLDDVEEERRLFFVALTRAEERLYLSCAEERLTYGQYQHNLPSRFLKEIPPELMEVEFEGVTMPAEGAAPARPSSPRPSKTQPRAAAGPAKASPPPVGTKVKSRVFGTGVIRSVAKQGPWTKVSIDFARAGTKKIILEKADLEILSE